MTRILILLVLALTQWGCDVDYGENLYPLELWNLEEVRSGLEREKREKRELLKIEDLQVGDGAIASWGRRLKAEIDVRYADGGTIIYKGPLVTYAGFKGLLASDLHDRFMLSSSQPGIQFGLNGMAVGGKRRVTISPELVCGGNDQGCFLLRPERQFVNEIGVSKAALVVEVTLTESCAPVRFRWRGGSSFTLVDVGAGCRTKSEPKGGGADWHIY